MTVLITGGAGFIGQHLAARLSERGVAVTALDTLDEQVHSDPEASKRRFPGEVVVADVADPASFTHFDDAGITAVVHLAAETGTSQSMYEQEHYRRVNVGGTVNAVEAAHRWGVPIVALSSRAVYGEGDPVKATTEDTPHRPLSVYGETKSEGETAAIEALRGEVPLTIIRPQNVIGPGQALHNPYTGVLSAFLAKLKAHEPLTVYGTGEQTRDFVHVKDLAALIDWALFTPIADESNVRILNCGSGVRITLNDLARFAVAASPDGPVEITHIEVKRAGDIDHALADITRLKELGAPVPQWQPADAVRDFIQASWNDEGADPSVWDKALDELAERGLLEGDK
ncbi:NAD-dependent epimerase/dehydratase family protein [Dermabacteraceae bacterium P13095]